MEAVNNGAFRINKLVLILVVMILKCGEVSSEFDNIKKLALANNEFALKLYQSFDKDENILFSPINIFTDLGMLYKGAQTSTAQEMNQILSYDAVGLTGDKLHQTFNELFKLLNSTPNEYQLEIANVILFQSDYSISDDFREAIISHYDAILQGVNFANQSDKIVREVNNWVSEKTHGKIKKLLNKLEPLTRIVLLSAVYFKGLWKVPFSPSRTFNQTFYNDGTHKVRVPMMHIRDQFLYNVFPDKEIECLVLPYIGDDVSMVILLPLEIDGLDKIERDLTVSQLNEMLSNMHKERVIVTLPKFRIKDSRNLKENLENIGVKSIFNENLADFSGISENSDLYVSEIVHKAVIKVNEKGSEAAASTAIVGLARSGDPKLLKFLCDHPFIFIIRDNRSGAIIFMGRVNNL